MSQGLGALTRFYQLPMIRKPSDRWPLVSLSLGLLLLSVAAADGRALLFSGRDEEWSLVFRAEVELYGGLWLLCGLFPRWAWRVALTALAGILLFDAAQVITGSSPRPIWGRLAAGRWWVLGGDLVAISALLRWRPSGSWRARVDTHPGRIAGAALVAAAFGVALEWSAFGQFPIVATAPSVRHPSSPGLNYLVYLPQGYHCSSRRWPLILTLHGAGAVGHDLARVRAGCVPQYIESGGRLPFIVVAPQSPQHGWDVDLLDSLLDEVVEKYRVDTDRVYLTGASMGGKGVWALAATYPERFAAIAPICGGGDPASAVWLRGVPTWAFHGAEDTVIPAEESRKMVAALEQAGGDVRLTIYPRVGHDAATPTYSGGRLYDWFLDHRRRSDGTDAKRGAAPKPARELTK